MADISVSERIDSWPFTECSIISPLAVVKDAFNRALREAFPDVELDAIVVGSNPKFGDLQCNSAMSLFKEHNNLIGLKSPAAVAERLASKLHSTAISNYNVAPQGFITVTIDNKWLADNLIKFLKKDIKCTAKDKKRTLVDFSSPNIAKEMHVGHLRSTIIGEAICRILEFIGLDVLRINHLGDWGTQFGMLIEHMRSSYPDFQNNPPALADLCIFYREAKKRFDSDEDYKKRSQLNVVALQSGDKFALAAWKLFCEISRKEFQEIYNRLDVRLDDCGESFYNDLIPNAIKELREKKLIIDSCGAQCFFVEDADQRDKEIPLMVVKSDGGYGYDSTDIAAVRYRLKDLKCDRVIYVTDTGQELHFRSLFKAAKLAGWHTPPLTRLDHIGFGVVQGDDGKKFKTRSGESVKLTSLLDEAVSRALCEVNTRRETAAASKENLDDSELQQDDLEAIPADVTAKKIGYSAVKYFDLKQNRLSNYKFSYDKMLDPKGNTAVYLLYAYARICAIFRKAKVNAEDLTTDNFDIVEPEERGLVLHLLKFSQVVATILEDMDVHRLADYIYEASVLFTCFYQKCRVVGSPEQNNRLILCEMTRKLLKASFNLLGIQELNRI